MINRGLSVKKTTLIGCMIVFMWFTPYYLYRLIPSGNDIFTFLRLLLNLYLIYYSGTFKRSKNTETLLILLYSLISLYGVLFVSSITFGKLCRFLEFVTFIFAALGLFKKNNDISRAVLRSIRYLGVIYGILNLLLPSIKIGSGYGGEYFFIGSETSSVQLLSAMMVVSAYLDLEDYGKIKLPTFIIGISEFLFAVQNESGQGRVMTAVFAVLMILNWVMRDKVWRALSPWIVIVAVVFLNVATITLSFQNWPIARYIIVDLLGKDMTLTGRDYIFTACLNIFAGHPLLGYGYESSIVEDTLSSVFIGFNTAHNSFLQLLINSGVLGIVAFFAIILLALSYVRKNDKPSHRCIYFGIIALMAGGIVSMVLTTSYFWILLALALSEKSKYEEADEISYYMEV